MEDAFKVKDFGSLQKERLVDEAGSEHSVSRRCKVLGIRRQTYHWRKAGHRPEALDDQIAAVLHETVGEFVAWGFWMIFHYLRRQGHGWNHKKVYRVWKAQGLNLRKKPRRSRIKRKFLDLIAPGKINQGWAMDFLSDWVVGEERRSVRLINIMDEGSRKALWTEAYETISAKRLVGILKKIVAWRGKPQYIRCDNGPEFLSLALAKWAEEEGIELRFTQPGKPTQNGLIERLNGTLRTECLNLEWFDSLSQLNEALQRWWKVYNPIRPHSSIQYGSPDEFEEANQHLYFSAGAG